MNSTAEESYSSSNKKRKLCGNLKPIISHFPILKKIPEKNSKNPLNADVICLDDDSLDSNDEFSQNKHRSYLHKSGLLKFEQLDWIKQRNDKLE